MRSHSSTCFPWKKHRMSWDIMSWEVVPFKCFWQKWGCLFMQLCSVLTLPKQCFQWVAHAAPPSLALGRGPSSAGSRGSSTRLQESGSALLGQAGSTSSAWADIRFHCRTVTGLSCRPQRVPAASSESPVAFLAVFVRLGTVWDAPACAAIITEHYIHSTKHSLCCLDWNNRELSATSSTGDRESSCLDFLVQTEL